MGALEFAEWMAFFRVEPFGDVRGDLQAGIVASTVANVNRDPKKRRPFSPADFLPDFEKSRAEGGKPSEVYAVFRTWAVLMSGQVNR